MLSTSPTWPRFRRFDKATTIRLKSTKCRGSSTQSWMWSSTLPTVAVESVKPGSLGITRTSIDFHWNRSLSHLIVRIASDQKNRNTTANCVGPRLMNTSANVEFRKGANCSRPKNKAVRITANRPVRRLLTRVYRPPEKSSRCSISWRDQSRIGAVGFTSSDGTALICRSSSLPPAGGRAAPSRRGSACP